MGIKISDQVPYRLLEPQDEYSFGQPDTPNMLIHGDNLEGYWCKLKKSLLKYKPYWF